MYKLEFGTEAGQINLRGFFALIVLCVVAYAGDRTMSVIETIFGKDSSAFQLLPILIFLGVFLMLCVLLIFLGEIWRRGAS